MTICPHCGADRSELEAILNRAKELEAKALKDYAVIDAIRREAEAAMLRMSR